MRNSMAGRAASAASVYGVISAPSAALDRWLHSGAPAAVFDRVSDRHLVPELAEAADLLAFYLALPSGDRSYPPG